MHRSTPLRLLVVATVSLAVACGGDDSSAIDGPDPTSAPAAAPDPADDDASTGSDPSETGAADAGSASTDTGTAVPDDEGPLERGDDRIRLVNLLDEPVDVYVRTTGLVRAELVLEGLAPGSTTPYLAPPPGGRLIALEAGADDPTCVSPCPQILASVTTEPSSGPVVTAVLFTDDRSGQVRTFTAHELPPEDAFVNSSVMAAAEPDVGLVVPLGIALRDAEFGLGLASAVRDGCMANRDESNLLVGGTTTVPFEFDTSSATITFHSNTDRDCADDPVGGPYTVTTELGTRTLLVLWGAPGSMEAITLSLSESVPDHDTEDPTPIASDG